MKNTSALVLPGAFSAWRRCPAGLIRLNIWTAFETRALRLSQVVELLLQAIQFVIRAALPRDEAGARMLDRAEEFVQFEVQGAGIAILGALNQKHDQKRHNGGPGINHQLLGVGEMKRRPAQAPDQDDRYPHQKGPRRADNLGRAIRQFPESLTHPFVLPSPLLG